MKKLVQGFACLISKIIGWKVVGETNIPDKCVFALAPHTSNWDLPLGLVLYTTLGHKASFLLKKWWFFFPMNLFFRAIGGVPVDRSKRNSIIEQMIVEYRRRSTFYLAIAPEGTRKYNPNWKLGFYYIALEAQVPIVVVALDYKLKQAQFRKIFRPTGNVEADMAIIKSCYVGVTARHPEKFAL